MIDNGALSFLPIWAVFLATVGLVLLSIAAGVRLGRSRGRVVTAAAEADQPPVGEIVAATLALLAFMIAFTFGVAASRFDVRKGLVIEESNAIGTTFLRAGLLSEPHRTHVRDLLRAYVGARLEAVQPGKLAEGIRRSDQLHVQLWNHAEAVGREAPGSIVVGLFIGSLNEVIDLHAKRLALGVGNRIPRSIWVVLYFVTILGTFVMGYHAGLSNAVRPLAILTLALAFSAVMTLIVDLDRPQEGGLRVSQQSMIDLQQTLSAPDP